MKAKVIEGCVSCGLCINICPEVFRFDDTGLSEVYAGIKPEHENAVQEAADSCPVSVIIIEK